MTALMHLVAFGNVDECREQLVQKAFAARVWRGFSGNPRLNEMKTA